MIDTVIGHLVLENDDAVVPVAPQVRGYLHELAELGLWGRTEADVAAALIQHGVRQLIADGTLKLRRAGAGLLAGRRQDD